MAKRSFVFVFIFCCRFESRGQNSAEKIFDKPSIFWVSNAFQKSLENTNSSQSFFRRKELTVSGKNQFNFIQNISRQKTDFKKVILYPFLYGVI
jgi:hypothetical protein